MIKPDTQLGHYRVIRQLGSGGMADVYEAEDGKLGRHVALKVLPPELGRNPQFITRFEREVRAAAGLNHHGIVTVFEVGEHDGLHYYSMRLLSGGDLRAKINGPMPEVEALAILREVSDAFAHAHTRGFVHRDVKPENIIFDDQGFPILTDFGIAKAMHGDTKVTATGVSIGTPRYISPEQARGHRIDARADIYALGVILYEMLTGSPPYDADESLAVIFKHVTEPVPKLPDELLHLQALIDTLMAKEPDERPDSAEAVIALIDQHLSQKDTREFRAVGTSQPNPVVQKLLTPAPPNQDLNTAETKHAEALATEHQRQVDGLESRIAEGDKTIESPTVAPTPAAKLITPAPPASPPPQHTPSPPPQQHTPSPPPQHTPAPPAQSTPAPPQSTLPAPTPAKNRGPLIAIGVVVAIIGIGVAALVINGDSVKRAFIDYANDLDQPAQPADGEAPTEIAAADDATPARGSDTTDPEAAAAAAREAEAAARRQREADQRRKAAEDAQKKQAELERRQRREAQARREREAEAERQRLARAEQEKREQQRAQEESRPQSAADRRRQAQAAEQRRAEQAQRDAQQQRQALANNPLVKPYVARDPQFIERHQAMLDQDLNDLAVKIYRAQQEESALATAIYMVISGADQATLDTLQRAVRNEELKAQEQQRQAERIRAEQERARQRREQEQQRLRSEQATPAAPPTRINLNTHPLVQRFEAAEPGFIKKYKDMYKNDRAEYNQILTFVSRLNPERAEAVKLIGQVAESELQGR